MLRLNPGSYQGGSTPAELYVRRPGEPRAWLVRARLDIEANPTDWLVPETLKVTKDRVRRVVTRHPDGEVLTIERLEGDTETPIFLPKDVPKGHKIKSNFRVNAIGGALESLSFDDVVPAADKDFGDQAVVSEFETGDGLKVTVRVLAEGEERWIQVRAAFDQALLGAAFDQALLGADADPEETEVEAVRTEAREIDARLSPWAYKIASYKADDFTHRMADLIEAVEPPDGDS